MRLIRFLRGVAYIACMVIVILFQVAVEMLCAGYWRARHTIALAGATPEAVPYLLRLRHLAWRLRSAPCDPWSNRVHCMRIACGIRAAKRELCASRAKGGQGIPAWRLRMIGV